MYNNIILPVDGSDYSWRAVKTSIFLQKVLNCGIIAFNSIKHDYLSSTFMMPFPIHSPGYGSSWTEELTSYELEKGYLIMGRQILTKVEALFQEAEISENQYDLRLIKDETPIQYLKKITKNRNNDLVIVGVRGHNSTLKKTHIGSVTDKIMRQIPCSVLIVK